MVHVTWVDYSHVCLLINSTNKHIQPVSGWSQSLLSHYNPQVFFGTQFSRIYLLSVLLNQNCLCGASMLIDKHSLEEVGGGPMSCTLYYIEKCSVLYKENSITFSQTFPLQCSWFVVYMIDCVVRVTCACVYRFASIWGLSCWRLFSRKQHAGEVYTYQKHDFVHVRCVCFQCVYRGWELALSTKVCVQNPGVRSTTSYRARLIRLVLWFCHRCDALLLQVDQASCYHVAVSKLVRAFHWVFFCVLFRSTWCKILGFQFLRFLLLVHHFVVSFRSGTSESNNCKYTLIQVYSRVSVDPRPPYLVIVAYTCANHPQDFWDQDIYVNYK